jgi:hypothetical protein
MVNKAPDKDAHDVSPIVNSAEYDGPEQAINGWCVKCGYRLAWVLVRSKNVNATN